MKYQESNKKRLASLVMVVAASVVAHAHAGMFDRYLQEMVNNRAFLCVIGICHILCAVLFKRTKVMTIRRIRLRMYHKVMRAVQKWYLRMLLPWLPVTLTYGMYLWLIASLFFLFGFIVLIVGWAVFIWCYCKTKYRTKYMTSPRALFLQIQSLVYMGLGCVVYALVHCMDWFKSLFAHTDVTAFEDVTFEITPGLPVFIELIEASVGMGAFLAITQMILAFILWCKRMIIVIIAKTGR